MTVHNCHKVRLRRLDATVQKHLKMSSSLDIEQELARRMLIQGGTLIFLGVPEGTEFGIDMKSWNTAGDFRGIKMIPPGLHFVHYSAVSKKTGDVAPRAGFLHDFKAKDFVIKMWNSESEDLTDDKISDESIKRLKDNLLNIDRFLGPYPYDVLQKWKSLSSNITEELAVKLTPENGKIRSALELYACNNDDRPKGINRVRNPNTATTSTEKSTEEPTAMSIEKTSEMEIIQKTEEMINICESKSDPVLTTPISVVPVVTKRRSRPSTVEEREEDLLPHLKPAPGTALRLTVFPESNYPDDATPAEITKHCLDQTYVLNTLLKRHSRPIDIIGELEFAYVCFLIGHSLDAFEHWKKLVILLCSCEEAIKKYRNVYLQFVTTLETQIYEIPEEFLSDIVMNNNVIYVKLREFFRTVINKSDIDDRLRTTIDRFKNNLTENFMWDFSDLDQDDEDELPVIVNLP